jgi:TonB family protein
MTRNVGKIPESDNQENYEAAVLDFLDREMAAVRPTQKRNDQSEELDALVSDLLKQVITESDQPESVQKPDSDGLEDVFSEFPPEEMEASSPIHNDREPSPVSALSETDVKQSNPTEPREKATQIQPLASSAAPSFAPILASKSKMPMLVVASLCLLIAVAAAIYYFSSSSKKVSKTAESRPVAAAPVAPEGLNRDRPVSPLPADKAAVRKEIQAKPDSKTAALPSSSSASAIPDQGAEAPRAAAMSPTSIQAATPAKTALESTQPEVSKRPVNIVPDKEPAQVTLAAPAAPLNIEKAETNTRPPAPALVGSGTLVPAVPISQTSPIYPEVALQSRASGSVVLDLQIDKEGKVVKAIPVSGPVVFHDAAVSAVMKWRYKPASVGGTKVPSQTRVTMVFNLKK